MTGLELRHKVREGGQDIVYFILALQCRKAVDQLRLLCFYFMRLPKGFGTILLQIEIRRRRIKVMIFLEEMAAKPCGPLSKSEVYIITAQV